MQEHAFNVLRCGLFVPMGMGKTSAVLNAIAIENEFGESGRTLVLAPLRVAQSTWPDEVHKWDHLKTEFEVSVVTGTPKQRAAALARDANLYTTNYDNLAWLVEHFAGRPWPFRTVVADESTRLKSFRLKGGGVRAQALGKVAHRGPKRWINLTGTPSPNGLQDLWGQQWFLDAGAALGRTFTAFVERWFQQGYDGYGITPLPFAQEQIQDQLRASCLSLRVEDHFDIDLPIVRPIYVDLPRAARKRYDEMEKEMFTILEGEEIEAFNAAARTIKCLQLAAGAAYLPEDETKPEAQRRWTEVHSEKLDALESIVQEAAGMPVLVSYFFKTDLARLKKAFPKGRELDKNPQTIRDWNAGKIPMLFAHPESAGHGLNLQDGGNILVYFTRWWNAETDAQILERIGPVRQAQAGHPRPVFVYVIIARDTVDELVMTSIDKKVSIQNVLMDAMRRRH